MPRSKLELGLTPEAFTSSPLPAGTCADRCRASRRAFRALAQDADAQRAAPGDDACICSE